MVNTRVKPKSSRLVALEKKKLEFTNKSTAEVSEKSNKKEKVFEVSKIIGIRIKKNQLEYSIHWKNYTLREATWESESNVDKCDDLIKQFANAKKSLEQLPKNKKSEKTPAKTDDDEFEVESINGVRIDVKKQGQVTANVSGSYH